MKYRVVPIIIVFTAIIIGHIIKRIKIRKLNNRKSFTIEYQNKFINLVNWIIEKGEINQDLYNECIHDVNKIQAELGYDGVLSEFIDPIQGIQGKNYQLFVNLMPEVRRMLFMWGNSIAEERFNQMIGLCDDSLRKHVGNIDNSIDAINNNLFNPFSCFGESIRWLITLPVDILYWCGLLGDRASDTIKKNRFTKFISNIIVFIGLIGSVVTIILGWDELVAIFRDIMKK